MKLYYTTSSKLADLPLEDGQIIFCEDEQLIYLTYHNRRLPYPALRVFDLEIDRQLATPAKGFYYVKETNVLWRYDSSWKQITPEGLKPIIFGADVSSFPEEGDEQTLYAGDDAIYKWKSGDRIYYAIANRTAWSEE